MVVPSSPLQCYAGTVDQSTLVAPRRSPCFSGRKSCPKCDGNFAARLPRHWRSLPLSFSMHWDTGQKLVKAAHLIHTFASVPGCSVHPNGFSLTQIALWAQSSLSHLQVKHNRSAGQVQ